MKIFEPNTTDRILWGIVWICVFMMVTNVIYQLIHLNTSL